MTSYIVKALAQYEHEMRGAMDLRKNDPMAGIMPSMDRQRNDAWWSIHYLKRMAQAGSCVSLSWDEESQVWECSWITGGQRFTAHDTEIPSVIIKAIKATGNPTVLSGNVMQPGPGL